MVTVKSWRVLNMI